MSNTILLKRNGNAAAVPLAANLTLGELSLNYADGVLYFLNSGNVVTVLANANTASGTQLVNGTSNVVTRTSGNVTVSSAGTANVLTISSTGIYTTGLSSVSGNITGGNITGQTEVLKGTGQNLAIQSAALTNGVWTTNNATVTGSQTDPFSGTTAIYLTDNSTSGTHLLQQTSSYSPNTNTYTFSLYAKAGTSNYIGLYAGGTVSQGAYWNLTTGAFTSVINAGSPTSYSSTNTGLPAGWWRLSITFTGVASNLQILMSPDGTTFSYVGTGSTVYFAAPQLEIGSTLNTYISTTTTAVYGTPTLSFSGVATLSLASTGTLNLSPAGSASTNVNSNLAVTSTTTSTSTTTGALVVSGGVGIAGNVYSGGIISATGSVTAASVVGGVITGSSTSVTGTTTAASVVGGVITGTSLSTSGNITGGNILFGTGNVSGTGNISGSYFIGNGSQLTGLPASGLKWTTVANTAPSGANAGDFWYNSYTGIKYQYTNDGTGNVWVDQSFPTSFSTLVVTGNATVGNISATNYTGTTASVTGNITGSYILGNGSQLTGVTAASFAPVMFNDVSTQTNGNTAVFALLTDQTATTGISNSKQLQVTVNGALVTPYITPYTWPYFTTYYRSYPGFRVTTLGYGLTANSVVIYNAPAISSQVTITQVNTATDTQLRRYPYSATAIAIGD